MYLKKRIDSQVGFYKSRIRENEANSDFTFNYSTLIMTLASLFATVSASDPTGNLRWLTILSAILPALAALLGAFRQLYGWDRQTTIYKDARIGLERAQLIAPDDDRREQANLLDVFPRIVNDTEGVLSAEVNQWGQYILSKEADVDKERGALERMAADMQLTEAQMEALKAVLANASAQIVAVSTSETRALPPQSAPEAQVVDGTEEAAAEDAGGETPAVPPTDEGEQPPSNGENSPPDSEPPTVEG
jgi:hypothetical protein